MNVDERLAREVADGLCMEAMPKPMPRVQPKKVKPEVVESRALSLLHMGTLLQSWTRDKPKSDHLRTAHLTHGTCWEACWHARLCGPMSGGSMSTATRCFLFTLTWYIVCTQRAIARKGYTQPS